MLAWALRWGSRCIGIIACVAAWMIAVGVYTLGEDWFADTVEIHSTEELLLRGIVQYGGETVGATVFFLGGVFLLWAFWRD